jgi:hypothetical protein
MAGNIKARILQNNTIRAKQVAIGQSGSADISQKSLNELADVDVTETDDGLLSYDATSDKWTTTTNLDGGTF